MNIFSIDVEDYYHVLDQNEIISIAEWDNCLPLVEKNLHKLFDLLDENNVKSTCFFLGYIGKRFPNLVKEAVARGHEIASHGMYHQLINKMNQNQLRDDLVNSKKLLEDLSGQVVKGFRAPSFSVFSDNPYFFEELALAGYSYDSSIFPANHDFGGYKLEDPSPFKIKTKNGIITEFPITIARLANKRLCFFGGGFLRFFPYFLIKSMANQVISEGRPIVFYIHPREIDPTHPRLKMSFKRSIKSYINLKTTEPKLNSILREFKCTSFKKYIEIHEVD